MTGSVILGRVANVAAVCFYSELLKTEIIKSFKLKVAPHAGKARVAPAGYRQAGLRLTCLDGSADAFWEWS